MLKAIFSLALTVILVLSFASCEKPGTPPDMPTGNAPAVDVTDVTVETKDMDLDFSNRDNDPSYNSQLSPRAVFSDGGISVSGNGMTVNGNVLTITAEGTYILSGKSSDAKIIVNSTSEAKIQIVLEGLSLECKSGSPFVVACADKVFVTLAAFTENSFADAPSYEETVLDSTVDAAVFSKEDITFNGGGTLTVKGNYKHGIVSKDDLVFTEGSYSVTSSSTAIEGNDCVKISSGSFTVNAGTDGIRSTNVEDTSRGFVYITGGTFNINSENDAFQAETLLKIEDGTFDIVTGGGSKNSSSSGGGMWGGGFGGFGGSQGTSDSVSAKALKCTSNIVISGGSFKIDSSDDAVHSNSDVLIEDGSFEISSGDDGMHGDNVLQIKGGNIVINKSYEGLEAQSLLIDGGEMYVVASDDGVNAAGGNDMSAIGGRPGQNGFNPSAGGACIEINGGKLVVNASGDGIDSNGNINMTGGVVLVSGPTNSGNGSFDYDGSANVSGGILLAVGSSGMAQGASGQNSFMTNISTQQGGSTFAVCDEDGNILVSFVPMKQYQNVVLSSASLTVGKSYSIIVGGTVTGADSYGFTSEGKISGGNVIATVEQTTSNVGGGGMGGPGGGIGGPGGGGQRPQKPGR